MQKMTTDKKGRFICKVCKRPIFKPTAKTIRAGKKMIKQEENGVVFYYHESCFKNRGNLGGLA